MRDFLAYRSEPAGGFRRLPWAVAVWAAFVLAAYHAFSRTPFLSPALWLRAVVPFWRISWPAACRHASYAARLLAFVVLTSALGRGLLRRVFRAEGLNVFESASFGFGLGLGVVGLTSLALGLCHRFDPKSVAVLAALLSLLAIGLNAARPVAKPPASRWTSVLAGPGCVLLAVLAAYILAVEGFYALAPETSYDATVYHLSLPALYRLSGGIVAAPTLAYSGFPMLVEWAYGFMLFFSDEIAAKLIHWACGLGIATAFLGLGLRSGRPLIGWVAAVVFLSTPLTAYALVAAGTDVAAAYLVLLTVYGAALGIADDGGGRGLDLSAVLCGLAMGVKYTVWPLLPVLALVLLALKTPRRDVLRFSAVALLVASPWLVKNALLYRNPVFPFFQESLVPGWEFASAWRALGADAWGRDWAATLADPSLRLEALLHPWFMTMFDFSHSGHLGPVYLMALPAFFLVRPASSEAKLWLRVLLGLWLCWWLTSAMPRLFLPGLCLLAVFVGAAVDSARERRARGALLAALAVVALNGISFASWTISRTGAQDYLVGRMSKEDYLRTSRPLWPNSYYNAAEWLDRNAPPSARVLAINGGRGYYLTRPFLTSSRLDEDLLAHWLKRSRTAEDLRREFEEAGVTHLLVNMAWLWGQEVPDPGVTPAEMDVLEDFLGRHARLRYNDLDTALGATRWTDVYEIVPGTGRPQPVLKPLLRWYRLGGKAGLGADGRAPIEFDPRAR